ncbi:MAG TPA: hypothetical protein V6C96_00200 [Vampirovibrionales bacterium]
MTKAELEKENKELKATIRKLQKETVNDVESKDLSEVAYGVTLVGEEKKLGLVKIYFDLSRKCAIIDEGSLITDSLGPIAAKARTKIVDEVIKRNKER